MKIEKRIQAKWKEPLILDKGAKGRRTYIPEPIDLPDVKIPDIWQRKSDLPLPEVSELELVRHVVRLSQMIHSVDIGPYPLGSCTMKYNPKINERIARLEGFAMMHPDAPDKIQQGSIEISYKLQEVLEKLTGFHRVSVQPVGGAQGEYTGVLIMRAYHLAKGDTKRKSVIVPDSAHGTNPASAAMAGYEVIELPTNEKGIVDLEALKEVLDDTIAGIMLTNPNTLGIFEKDIIKINEMVHAVGGLSYMDGANFNGIVGVMKPVAMGFDIMHMNLHKTFTGPHGGGGPGSGPVGVIESLAKHLPIPLAAYDVSSDKYYWDYSHEKSSIGRLHGYNGNFGINLRALAYVYRNGGSGLREVCETAVLHANYIMHKVREIKGFVTPRIGERPCKHEFIASAARMLSDTGVSANDIGKAMLDYGVHTPTVYFPLIIREALLIEPTESETRADLDLIVAVLRKISEDAYEKAELVTKAPFTTSSGRLDEMSLAKNPILSKRMIDAQK
jgi:glycine dehydrogenase subunit 2